MTDLEKQIKIIGANKIMRSFFIAYWKSPTLAISSTIHFW